MAAIQMAVLLMSGSSTFTFNQTISEDTKNYNLRSAALAGGWDGIEPLNATVTVNSGIYVGATGTGLYGFDTGTPFPDGSTLALVNNGFIVGAGGGGGASPSGAGKAGGPAMRALAAISITNNGTIGGGGGGGGAGPIFGGGGGQGYSGGGAGGGAGAGTKTAPGAGGSGGGSGGVLGAGGVAGSVGAGGAAGAAVVGNANITWVATGTRLGPIT